MSDDYIEVLEKVNKLYRQQRDKVNQIKKEIFVLEDKLKDTDIPYKKYIQIQNDLQNLKEKFIAEQYVADGIYLAKEKFK